MVRIPRLFGVVVALVGITAFIGTAFAKHQHHPGHQLLGSKINTDVRWRAASNGSRSILPTTGRPGLER